jgi:hypothetical protein
LDNPFLRVVSFRAAVWTKLTISDFGELAMRHSLVTMQFKHNHPTISSFAEWQSMDDDSKESPISVSWILLPVIALILGTINTSPLSAQISTDKAQTGSPVTAETARASSPLEQLDWLIGEWVAKGDVYQARSTACWSENRKFIVSQFTVERPGGKSLCGTQRIGWDPAAERIRSWVFDSDGGISEGIWQQEGDAWVVKNVGVLPDSRRSSAANFWVRDGNDKYAVKSSHVKVDDDTVADFEVEFRRVRGGR